MAAKKIYKTFPALEKDFKAQDLKFAKLIDQEGNDLVSFNTAMNKNKGSLNDKLKEISRKLNIAEDGIYFVVGQHRFGKNVSAMKFCFNKNFTGNLEEAVVIQERGETKTDKLLSVESALENVKDAAGYRAENIFLKEKVEDLKEQLAEAKADLKEAQTKIDNLEQSMESLESQGEEKGGGFFGLGETIKEIMPVAAPIFDRLLNLQERKQKFTETKFLNDNGYDIPGLKKRAGTEKKPAMKEIPEPGSQDWPEFIQYLLNLPEEQFGKDMERLKQYPETYNAAAAEVYDGEEEEEEEEEEEQQ